LRGEETGNQVFRKMKIDLELKKPIETHLMVFFVRLLYRGDLRTRGEQDGDRYMSSLP
jgi:hypothetical protein